MEAIVPALAVLAAALVIFVAAVWFGRAMLAPRIGRALDRAEANEEEPGDRPD
jgi:hypothetical protein